MKVASSGTASIMKMEIGDLRTSFRDKIICEPSRNLIAWKYLTTLGI